MAGMLIRYKIIENHRDVINVALVANEGTLVTITLLIKLAYDSFTE